MWETRLHAVAPCAREFYRERLQSEVDALREADHLDHVLDVVDALLAARGAGVATVPALRTSELLVFYLAGVSDVDPVTEGLDGRLSIKSTRAPTCLWFGSGDGAHLVPCVPLVVLSRSLTPERVHSSTLWHDDASAELAALDAWRRASGEDGPQAETPEVTTWDDLVLRQALRTPAAEARSLYGQVESEERFRQGAGKELDGKMRAPHSSSVLAYNMPAPCTFDQAARDAAEEVFLSTCTGGLSADVTFECKRRTAWAGTPPHLDAEIVWPAGHVVVIESKFSETFSVKGHKRKSLACGVVGGVALDGRQGVGVGPGVVLGISAVGPVVQASRRQGQPAGNSDCMRMAREMSPEIFARPVVNRSMPLRRPLTIST